MPQDEPAGKTTGLAEQRALAGTQETKEGLPPMEERPGDSRGVQGSCREEIRKAKAQLELRLALL